MPAKRKAKPSPTGAATGGDASAARELPEFIDRLYRKIQNAPPGKKKWAAEAVDELSRLMDLSEKLLADAASVRGLAIVRAQSSPEYLDTLKALDPLAPAFARGVKAGLELLKEEGGLCNTDRVAEILDISPQAVIKRHSTGKLLALTLGRRGFRFPAWQFNEERRAVVPGLEEVLSALSGHDPWMQNVFFLSPSSRLNDRRPLDVLREGRFEPAIEAARVFLEQGAA
ncbi:MAG TPA: hypothetical protein VKJ01_15680 [Candidatus Solibacter sp.]|nr:hypothetical protein [Candidatus Solibacter sp.]